jgi:hypothetical protein
MPAGPRRDGLVRVLTTVRSLARAQGDDVLGLVPDTGDRVTGRAVDDFAEQAADALRALHESASEALLALGAAGEGKEPASEATGAEDAYPSGERA